MRGMTPEQREEWDTMLNAPLVQPTTKKKGLGSGKPARPTQAEIDADMASFFSAQQILGQAG